MPIDPSIVSGLAPAAANLAQMGTFAQQQTAMEAHRKRQDEQRQEQELRDIMASSPDLDTAIDRLNKAGKVEYGTKLRTQSDDHRKKLADLLEADSKRDLFELDVLGRAVNDIKDDDTLAYGKKIASAFGVDGQRLASLLPEKFDPASTPQQIEALMKANLTAKEAADQLYRSTADLRDGKWRSGLANALATADNQQDWDGAMRTYHSAGMPASELAEFPTQFSPEALEKVKRMTMTEQQRQTLAGQAATRDDAAAQRDIANARADQQLAISQEHLNLSRQANARAAQGGGSSAEGGGGLTPDAVDYIATQYRILGPSGIPTRISEGERIRIANAAASQVKSLGQSPVAAVQKQAAYKSDSAALTQMTKMREAAGSFENKAVAQADIVGQLSDKVGRTSSPMLNSWWLAGKKEVAGDTDTALLYNAIQTFASEYAKIMEGSTGSVAASSDSARKASENLIKASMSPKTTRAAIDLMKREMGLTMQGYDATIAHITERMGGAPTGAASRETLGPNQRAIKGGGVAELRNGEWVRIR